MQVGIIVTKTPAEVGFKTFLKFAGIYAGKANMSIYLAGNGVFSARRGHLKEKEMEGLIKNSIVQAYSDDLKARGIAQKDLIEGIEVFTSYDDMVKDLMENKAQILSF